MLSFSRIFISRHSSKKTAVFVEKSRKSVVKVTVEAPLDFGDITAYVDIFQIQSENQVLAVGLLPM